MGGPSGPTPPRRSRFHTEDLASRAVGLRGQRTQDAVVGQGLVFQDASKRIIYEEMNDTDLLQDRFVFFHVFFRLRRRWEESDWWDLFMQVFSSLTDGFQELDGQTSCTL